LCRHVAAHVKRVAAGYGELSDKLDENGAPHLLKAPYGRADLAELLEGLSG